MTHPKPSRSIDLARRREVAARHHIDLRTLDRALDGERPRGMAGDRALEAVAELLSPSAKGAA
jgi:hypothetical protein